MLRMESGLIFTVYGSTTRSTRTRPGCRLYRITLRSDKGYPWRPGAIVEREEHPQREEFVSLELEGDEVAGHRDEVYIEPSAARA